MFGNNSKIFDANNWSVTLEAGYDFVNNVDSIRRRQYLFERRQRPVAKRHDPIVRRFDQLARRDKALLRPRAAMTGKFPARCSRRAAEAFLRMRCPATSMRALPTAAAPAAARRQAIIIFTASVRRPNAILGGISTAAGGNVTLIAGNNIDSTPTVPIGRQWPGASGAYGSGNVTIIAGNQITEITRWPTARARCSRACRFRARRQAFLQNPQLIRQLMPSTLNGAGNGSDSKRQRQWQHRRA